MKNYLVIGGSSGIGKTLSQKLASSGNQVYATFRTSSVVATPGIQFHFYEVMSDQAQLGFLPDTIHGLAYCPGNIDLKPFTRIKPESFVEDFNLQVVGAIKIIQAALPALKKADKPGIVLFSSVAVRMGFPFHTKVAASKGAVEGLTLALAAELAPSIRVNCIAPSITDTPLAGSLLNSTEKKEANAQRHPLKSIGTTHDIAAMAAYLLSEDSKWISGQVIAIDGGISSLKT